jgi:(1->4)-alpha-D-glucan 1-alpha-D-glucosylmutase
MPEEWGRQAQIWSRLLRARRGDVEGVAPPDRNDEYLFYQALVGSWPVELLDGVGDEAARAAFVARLQGTMVKSVREAKVHTTWAAPNAAYEDAVRSFVADALDPARAAVVEAMLPFVSKVAELGVHNSLVQTTLKLTVPGVPDIYQGAELWDLAMVDPDNRRPVDYAVRTRLLDEVRDGLAQNPRDAFAAYLKTWRDGRVKLAAVATLLAFRAAHPELFAQGGYEPWEGEGPQADQVCAFVRRAEEKAIAVAALRFPARLRAQPPGGETVLHLPQGRWRDLFTAAVFEGGNALRAGDLFATLPVAALALIA